MTGKSYGRALNSGTHKWCPSCGALKERGEFYANRASQDGNCSECKLCRARLRNSTRVGRLHDAHVKKYHWRLAGIERNRARRRAKAEAEGREIRPWHHLTPEERAIPKHVRLREQYIEQKREWRKRKAAEEGRELQPPRGKRWANCNAHIKARSKWLNSPEFAAYLCSLPYAHVDAWRRERDRLHWIEVDKFKPGLREKWIARRRRHREQLSDYYILRVLQQKTNLLKDEIPLELIEAQRAVLKLKRATRGKHDEDND